MKIAREMAMATETIAYDDEYVNRRRCRPFEKRGGVSYDDDRLGFGPVVLRWRGLSSA